MELDSSEPKISLARLLEAESTLLQTGDAGSAKHYVNSVMLDVINPLEAINNLIYVVKQKPADSDSLKTYIQMLEGEVNRLSEIVRRTLLFCKESPR